MDPAAFNAVQPHLDQIAEVADQHFGDPRFHEALAALAKIVGERYSVSITLTVDVFDTEQERDLPLLNTGLSTCGDREPYRTTGDCSPQRYVTQDGIQIVPHDRCPTCWEVWDFKDRHPTCPHCGLTLGEGCKILLDTDVCPNCEKGKVSAAKPQCRECGYKIDPKTVVWG